MLSDLPAPERHILVVGDTHGDEWLVDVIRDLKTLLPDEPHPVVLQLGDFGIWPGNSGAVFLHRVNTALEEAGADLLFIHGNHEDHDQLAALRGDRSGPIEIRPRITWLTTGTRWQWYEHTWVACGGAVSVDKALRTEGVDWWSGEELTEAEADALCADGRADVMVCHDRPSGAPLFLPPVPPSWGWALQDLARSDVHRERLQRVVDGVKPHLLLHGHYHLYNYCHVGAIDVLGLNKSPEKGSLAVVDVTELYVGSIH